MSNLPNQEEITRILQEGDPAALREVVTASHPADVADAIEELDIEAIWNALQTVPIKDAAEILSHLPIEVQERIAEDHDPEQVARIVEKLSADDRVDLIKQLEPELQQKLLAGFGAQQRRVTERLFQYDEATVGAVMSPDFAAVPAEMRVSEAMDLIRLEAPRKETVYYIFVMDNESRLIGTISLRDLILANPNEIVGDIMQRDVIQVRADEPRTVAADKIKDYDLIALPVVNGGGKLVGIVTVDDILDLEEEEATEDFHRMGTVGSVKTSLREASIALLFRARIGWLTALVFVNILSGAGIAHFEATIDAVVALVFFLPLLIASGGNAGSQAAMLMVRALATGDVRTRDWLHMFGKEILVATLLGGAMAGAVMLIAGFRAPDVLVPVGLTMVCVVIFGSVLGMSLPFVLTRFKLDPATASAPLITSIADIVGVLIYFTIASWWLGDTIAAAAEAAEAIPL
ncbi:MAG: magnesium transporter [Phycisphaeraceae bacterium]|nr:MAG: magnesium transporter [Phycisphaeraceae bacterium]